MVPLQTCPHAGAAAWRGLAYRTPLAVRVAAALWFSADLEMGHLHMNVNADVNLCSLAHIDLAT